MLKYKLTPVYENESNEEERSRKLPKKKVTFSETSDLLKKFPETEIRQAFSKMYKTKVNKWIKKLVKGFNRLFFIEKNSLNIVYRDSDVVGSNIVEMLNFFIIPKIKERPSDMKYFYRLCVDLKVPNLLLKKYKSYVKTNAHVMWKQI